jgi:hypothetical protein
MHLGANDLLLSLLKAGGIAALSIGVVYLLYREIIKLGIFPKLRQWQAFALLCLLAVLIFIIAMTALKPRPPSQALLDGELPPDNHFELDAALGVFCEDQNVRDDLAQSFDYVEINLHNCAGTDASASRTYRVDWPPQPPRSFVPQRRRNYRQCFASDFAARAPQLVADLEHAFELNKQRVPCEVTISAWRPISISYNDLRDQSHGVTFLQVYNERGDRNLDIRQGTTTKRVRNDQMEGLNPAATGPALDAEILTIAKQYAFKGIPREP